MMRFICSLLLALPALLCAQPKPPILHSHNDYAQARPLETALLAGAQSIEVDLWLRDGELVVAHTRREVPGAPFFSELYVRPLMQRIRGQGGSIYGDGGPVFLVLDLKEDAEALIPEIQRTLQIFIDGGILTQWTPDGPEWGPLAVVLSGTASDLPALTEPSWFALDARPRHLDYPLEATWCYPMVSANWWDAINFEVNRKVTDEEKARLRNYVEKAHRHGMYVRFWGGPDEVQYWHTLLKHNVDVLHTDYPMGASPFIKAMQRQ